MFRGWEHQDRLFAGMTKTGERSSFDRLRMSGGRWCRMRERDPHPSPLPGWERGKTRGTGDHKGRSYGLGVVMGGVWRGMSIGSCLRRNKRGVNG